MARYSNSLLNNKVSQLAQKMLAPTLLMLLVSGCAAVGDFSSTAVNYNLEAEKTKDQGLVLNIMRASRRKPLQFTDLSTVTGQYSGTLSDSLSLPLLGWRGSGSRLYTESPTASVSGGPNFTMSVLNTKEFYQGIMTPLSPQTADLYIREGIQKQIILNMLVYDISYNDGINKGEITNDAYHYERFQEILNSLMRDGLDIEEVDSATVVGPPLTASQLRDLGDLAKLDAQKIKIVRHEIGKDSSDFSKSEQGRISRDGDKFFYQLEKSNTSFRFCFNPRAGAAKENGDVVIGIPGSGRFDTVNTDYDAIGDVKLAIPKGLHCGASDADRKPVKSQSEPQEGATAGYSWFKASPDTGQAPIVPKKGKPKKSETPEIKQELAFTMRSVDSIIYYLGELVRREDGLLGVEVLDKAKPPFVAHVSTQSHESQGPAEKIFFKVSHDCDSSAAVSVDYDGKPNCIAVSPAGEDRSAQVLEVLAEMLALNNSAKDLPAPSIVPVITH